MYVLSFILNISGKSGVVLNMFASNFPFKQYFYVYSPSIDSKTSFPNQFFAWENKKSFPEISGSLLPFFSNVLHFFVYVSGQ